MKVTVVDLRYRMQDVLRAVRSGEMVTLVYRGKAIAQITPVPKRLASTNVAQDPAFGIWKDRKDMRHPSRYVQELRCGRLRSSIAAPRN